MTVANDKRAQVIDAVRRGGLSLRAAAAQFGVSPPTVKRWLDAVPEAPPAIAPPGPPPGPPPAPFQGDAAELTRAVLGELRAAIDEARVNGNHELFARLVSNLTKQGILLKQLEKGANEDADVVKMSRAEIEKGQEEFLATIAALNARPLLCAHCGAHLSADWGGLAKDARARLLDHAENTPPRG